MKVLLSIHDDDSVLFTAFTCLREKPLVVVCLDSYIQPNRGEIGCDHITRANETKKAHEILGCPVIRLGIPDNLATEENITEALRGMSGFDTVYAPALQGGNPHHDMVSRAAGLSFGVRVRYYTTYSKQELWTKGNKEIVPTEEELNLKYKALMCYQSQYNLPATRPHFEAVIGRSEFLM